jgi:hypothetical protein
MHYVNDQVVILPIKTGLPWYANMLIVFTVLTGVGLCGTIGFFYYRHWQNKRKVKKYIEIAHNLISLPKKKAFYEKIFMYATSTDSVLEVLIDNQHTQEYADESASTNAYLTTTIHFINPLNNT